MVIADGRYLVRGLASTYAPVPPLRKRAQGLRTRHYLFLIRNIFYKGKPSVSLGGTPGMQDL